MRHMHFYLECTCMLRLHAIERNMGESLRGMTLHPTHLQTTQRLHSGCSMLVQHVRDMAHAWFLQGQYQVRLEAQDADAETLFCMNVDFRIKPPSLRRIADSIRQSGQ